MGKKIKIGFIGFGNMGSAIAMRFADEGYELYAFDKDKTRLKSVDCLKSTDTLPELLNNSDIVILAVKPQDFGTVLKEIKDNLYLDNKIIISIAAGITTDIIEDVLGKVKVIRVMPNLFVATGNGVCGICKGKYAAEDHLSIVQDLFKCLGEVIVVSEDKMPAVTAISGSGPGYLCYLVKDDEPSKRIKHLEKIIPNYEEAARKIGLSQDETKVVVTGVAAATFIYLKKHTDDRAAKDFCNKVTSKGGTTEAAINVLKNKGEGALSEAIVAAEKRAKELADQMRDKIKKGQG